MSNTRDDMLAILKKQQATIHKQQMQINELIKQLGKLAGTIGKPDNRPKDKINNALIKKIEMKI